jgi:hypothetical protein
MIVDVARGALFAVATYLAIGSLVAVPFLIFGIGRVDPAAKAAPWTFRALVFPGVVAMWPLVVRRWLSSRRGR